MIIKELGTDRKEQEFSYLLEDIKKYNLQKISDISKFITDNNLSEKYGNISGLLKISQENETYYLTGGISPTYHKKLCQLLKIEEFEKKFKVVNFISFNQLYGGYWILMIVACYKWITGGFYLNH